MATNKNQKKGASRRKSSSLAIVEKMHKEAAAKKKAAADEPKKLSLPTAPSSLDKVGKEKWDEMIEILSEQGMIDRKYQMSLAIFCDAYSMWHTAGEKLKEMRKKNEDLILTGKKGGAGGMYRNPWMDVRLKAEEKIYKYLSLFGLSPFDDMRINPGKGKDPSSSQPSNPFNNL